MSASKKYMNEMIARYSSPGVKPLMMNQSTTTNTPAAQIIKPDPSIEIAKLQRQRQAQNIQRVNAARKLNAQRMKNSTIKNQKFTPDKRRPYDDVKVSRLARGTSQIVNAYDRYRKI